ncbi:MAG: hypothetical protein JWN54_3646 [Mycobacterium sp.]|jgi:hypothetical protein|nr:hypothetical protein [Mycobacterium sp.]
MKSSTPHVVASYAIRHATTRTEDVAAEVMNLFNEGVRLIDLSDHDRHARTVHLRILGERDEDR